MKSKEACQRSVVYGKTPSDSVHNVWSYEWDGSKKVRDNGSPPEWYLPPREYIA